MRNLGSAVDVKSSHPWMSMVDGAHGAFNYDASLILNTLSKDILEDKHGFPHAYH